MTPLRRIEPQIAALEAALARGRLHHAWLLTGPEGVGKAGFAWRAAGRLLGAASFTAPDDDPALRLMAAGAHPDFMVLAREEERGTLKRGISVDQARRLPDFFAKAPALGRYRVAVIDAADDLNPNAANAVLKTLEEPSAQGVIFLVSHAPGRLLPTLRSRCRRLAFPPWPEAAVAEFLRAAGRSAAAEIIPPMAQGSPGRALALADADAPALDAAAAILLGAEPRARLAQVQALAEGFRGEPGRLRFGLLIERLMAQAQARALNVAVNGAAVNGAAAGGEGWAAVWERLSGLVGRVDGLNLDRADALAAVLADLDRARAQERAAGC